MNPFFTRETRQLARRPLPLYGSLFALAGAMSCCLLPLLWWKNDLPDIGRTLVLVLLIGTHGLFCLGMGGYSGNRVFAEEHRRTTLEALRLLPISPLRWLLLKLAFPLYLLGMAWLAALPLYLCGAILNLASPALLLQAWWICPLVGLGALPVVLLLPPDLQDRARRARMASGGSLRHLDTDLLVRMFLVMFLMLALQFSVISLLGFAGWRGLPLYGGHLPGWVFLATVGALFFAASLATALATVSGREMPERRAARARLAALFALYYLDVGLFWAHMSLWVRIVLALLLPFAVWSLRPTAARRREDRLSSAETSWFGRLWDNPLFIRDFRVYTRVFSLRRTILANMLLLAVLLGGAYYLVVRIGGGSVQNLVEGGSVLLSFVIPMVLLTDLSMRPFMAWTRERTADTLPLLFLTPLRSNEILRGRLLAVICYSLSANAPLILAAALAFAWVFARFPVLAPAIFGGLPVAASAAIAFAGAVRTSSLPPWKWTREEWLEAGLGMVILASLFGSFALVIAPLEGGLAAETCWLLGLLLFCLNALVAWAVFRLRTRLLEALRRGDVEALG